MRQPSNSRHVDRNSPTVPDGKSGFKPMSGFVFAATIVAAQSDCSISNVVGVTSGCATASKGKNWLTPTSE